MSGLTVVEEQNEQLKRELADLQDKLNSQVSVSQHQYEEISGLKAKVVNLQKNVDIELGKRESIEAQNIILGLQLKEAQDSSKSGGGSHHGHGGGHGGKSKGGNKHGKSDHLSTQSGESIEAAKAATKIIRTVDQWMRSRDLEQALLRGSAISDIGFSTLSQVLIDCPSLHTLDLSRNNLTMDSCADICSLITSCPSLSYISLEGNLLSLRSIGYLMTAILERNNNKSLLPLAILHMQDNEGLIQAIDSDIQPGFQDIKSWSKLSSFAPPGPVILLALSKALWKFLHDTGHPQVKSTKVDQVRWNKLDPHTLKKMQAALSKILLLSEDELDSKKKPTTLTADQAIWLPSELEGKTDTGAMGSPGMPSKEAGKGQDVDDGTGGDGGDGVSPDGTSGGNIKGKKSKDQQGSGSNDKGKSGGGGSNKDHGSKSGSHGKSQIGAVGGQNNNNLLVSREKCQTFNLKQIITKNGTILMNMLERMLDSISIDARDIETGRTLLEHSCHTGNLALAKLCYRRGANLNRKALSGDTPFTIATKNKKYDLLEFFHLYGVKVNSSDANGCTALHVATANNDIDAICRLVEWGADVNLRDHMQRTPLHFAAIGGHVEVAMLLLELAADLNSRDSKEYTAAAHSENNDHFFLMDRLVALGGKGHGLSQTAAPKKDGNNKNSSASQIRAAPPVGGGRISDFVGPSGKKMGATSVSAGELKASALGRLGKWRMETMDEKEEVGKSGGGKKEEK